MRTIAKRKHLSKNTVSLAVLEIARETKGSIWIAKTFQPKWGNVLSFDAKFIRVFDPFVKEYEGTQLEKKYFLKKTWLCGIDVVTKDLPHYNVSDGETKTDLYEYFKTLKTDIFYDLKVLVCDGNPETMDAARMVYGNVGIQLCIRHFIESLKTIAREERQTEQKATENLIGGIWAALEMDNEADCLTTLKELSTIQETRCQKLIFSSVSSHILLLTTHFRFQTRFFVPRYNNDVENLFKQLNLRLKSWNMFRTKTNAQNYLKAWALARRFIKFTDCKKGINKLKNGRAPLELAGVKIEGIDYLNL